LTKMSNFLLFNARPYERALMNAPFLTAPFSRHPY